VSCNGGLDCPNLAHCPRRQQPLAWGAMVFCGLFHTMVKLM
jgi:hypothetical protein